MVYDKLCMTSALNSVIQFPKPLENQNPLAQDTGQGFPSYPDRN